MDSGSTIAIIQARMGATRLPGKVLKEIQGKPVLWYVINRLKKARLVDRVVVATTSKGEDNPIEIWCGENGVDCFRGSEHDVLDRYYQAAQTLCADRIVRITADCPFVDSEVVDRVIKGFIENQVDYATNTMPYSWPDGFDVEVFHMAALEKAWEEASGLSEREHVTPYLRNDPAFKRLNVSGPTDSEVSQLRLTVDHPDDLEYVRAIFDQFPDRWDVPFDDIVKLIFSEPESLPDPPNEKHLANEGLYKTILEEAIAGSAPPLELKRSEELFSRAERVVPGCSQTFSKSHLQHIRGVSPLFLERGEGSRVWDVDGNEYIDYIQGLLPNILGYGNSEVNEAFSRQIGAGHSFSLPHSLEVELAERLVEIIPCAEMVRFGKNGSDATSGAIRIARAFTGRERVACCGYHGWQDWYIGCTSRNGGVPGAVCELTHPFPYNDLTALEDILDQFSGEFAAIILEPFNFIEPKPGFLEGVKNLANKHGAVLIFDEICSGFHFGIGGAQKLFGVTPDLACFGKAMANGFPLSAVVGGRKIMKVCEDVFFSFTFGGEVASMAATLKVLDILENTDALRRIEGLGRVLQDGLATMVRELKLEDRIQCIGRSPWSLIQFLDSKGEGCSLTRSLFQQEVVKRGILILTTHNLSAAHTDLDIERTLEVYAGALKTIKPWLEVENPEEFLEGRPVQPVIKVR